MNIIEIKSVTKTYGRAPAVRELSLEVADGERLIILGPSGCGKTTLLRLIAGFIAPDSGSILIEGETVAADGRILREPEERNIGMVFQDLALWPHLSVEGNLEFGLKARGVPAKERRRRVDEMLQLVEMEAYAKSKPAALSGGQQQRIALARALILQPRALLMDEPLSNLDEELNRRMRKEILRLQKTLGTTLLYVTHDRDEARELGTRIILMRDGRLVEDDG